MGKLVIEIDTADQQYIGEPLSFLADVMIKIGANIPQLSTAAIPAEPSQHPSFVKEKRVALVFEASREECDDPLKAKIALRMGFVSDEFDTSQWRILKDNPNVAIIRGDKLVEG